MAPVGFIQDKLDIKFLILYVAMRLIEPVPFEVMQELCMLDDGIDFFDFSECLAHLVNSEHLTLSEDGLYAVTEKGIKNGRICETSIAYSVRLDADKVVAAYNEKLRRRARIKSSFEPRDNGTCTVHLSFSDDTDATVMKLELMVPGEEMAKDLTARFQSHTEQLYTAVINALYAPQEKTKTEKN
ncbi:MAG: DUF4364 family protein [Oscillospiraceae bacterium]|nr:DUF4364 family protein [Oscillospiraceae bacterium]MBR7149490.1 DUF4364 family protein [Oscillospiraceae bacterium]